MTPRPVELHAIDKVAEEYRRRGYEVSVAPKHELPSFLEGYEPDIIARRPSDSVVIEVKVGTQSSVERFREVAERINRQPGWHFSLVYVSPSAPDQFVEAEPASPSELEQRAGRAAGLLENNQPDAAFLLYWSALEGGLRLLGRRAQLPVENLPASALIRELYSSGELSADDLETLLSLLPARDRLAHGFVGSPEASTVESLGRLVRRLLAEAAGA